jgi:maltokinase
VIGVAQNGSHEYYQLVLASAAEPSDYLRSVAIGELDGGWYYDVASDSESAGRLLGLFDSSQPDGAPRFEPEPGVHLEQGLRARPITAEQSNSSIVFGHHYILKLFRKLSYGENRDLRLHRGLHAAGSSHIARPIGAVSGEVDGKHVTFGIMHEFLSHAVEGWVLATASVRDLMAEADLHAEEVGGDFAAEAHRLGAAVARVHADLAGVFGVERLDGSGLSELVASMHRRLDEVLMLVPDLGKYEEQVRETFDAAEATGDPFDVQQVHADLHLGQTMRSNTGWILIDFEGEPGIPAPERGAAQSALADVAGMIRSFDYAAHQHLVGYPADHQHAVRGKEWAARNADAFCDGYAEAGTDPRAHGPLLRAFVLHKAVYEVAYEFANRPDWLDIPLGAIRRITEG